MRTCKHCGREQTVSEYCVAVPGMGCIRYESVYISPDEIK